MQVTSTGYDQDTGTLSIRLDDGSEYQIDQPAIAVAIKDKISCGGNISEVQYEWLQQYRVAMRDTNRERLRVKLREIRSELRDQTQI